jgi:hypothetical protein
MRMSSLVCSGVTLTILVLYGTAARGQRLRASTPAQPFTAASSSLTP